MNARDVILQTYGFGERIVSRYLADLGDADLLVRPVTGQNHIAWQIGHLISTENYFVDAIKPGTSPSLPEGFDAVYARDETAVASDDPAKFLSKEEYVRLWKAQRDATVACLNDLPDAALDEPGPERVRQFSPTVGSTFLLIGNHALMHVGQFTAVRRKLGKPVAI
jgi:hypothetical protein